jgi:hypothetical protein
VNTLQKPIAAVLPAKAAKPACAQDEKLVATNTDVRLVLGFAAPAQAVASLLPVGWELDAVGSGQAKEVNLRLTFIDTLVTLNAEGKAMTPPRIAHLSLAARRVGSDAGATLLLLVCSSGGDGGPYGNSIHASASIARDTQTGPAGGTVVDERWQFRTRFGHAIDAHIAYTPAAPTLVRVEDRVHSAAKPDFHRIYRGEQAVVALRGPGADRVLLFDFAASGPVLAPVFDGSERLITADALPCYARQVFVPGSSRTSEP